MKKKLYLSIIIFSLLIVVLYVYTSYNTEDEKIITSFLNDYFKQTELTNEDWTKLIETPGSLNNFVSDFDKYVEEKELKRLTSNRQLPCLYFKELPNDYNYKILSISKSSSGNYEVTMSISEQTVNFAVRMANTQKGRKIEYIDIEKLVDKLK
ncbi:hypothetical protein HMPREF1142_1644 [Peptostreptococcaceae bacterium AS15]|nr:hypothetical protein HMPREF1142_1644 [Peptostreptococcaceae bacterium AS15]